MKQGVNIYQDAHTGGWVLELMIFGRWERMGYFGTRAVAVAASR